MKFKIRLTLFLLVLSTFGSSSPLLGSGAQAATVEKKRWEGVLPKVAEKPEAWAKLIPELMKLKLHYGALAAASRMLNFFPDIQSKDYAYRNLVSLIDIGYPYVTRPLFVTGDIEPKSDEEFGASYNLYKAIVNTERKMDRWAKYYFNKLDQEKTPKYQFYLAVELYRTGKLAEAIPLLQKILTNVKERRHRNFLKKVARTLARIHYELEEYDKSAEVYTDFLLKLNPVEPTDWIEVAWSFYRLKKYPEALGALYNLESKGGKNLIYLEKHIIRALVYREYCAVENTQALLASFNAEFGQVVNGIKMGEPLKSFPVLQRVEFPATQSYRQIVQTVEELEAEQKKLEDLPRDLRPLAEYLFSSEHKMLLRHKGLYEDEALESLANHLVILGESLRFLNFDVAREKYNPERIFKNLNPETKLLVEDVNADNFQLRWAQMGDFWRDERPLYKGVLKNRCDE